jgi:predicted nucleotidyltransferase
MQQGAKNNLTRQSILRALRRNDELLQKHAVRSIALFGSYATGRPDRKSDLDLLVDFERPTYDNESAARMHGLHLAALSIVLRRQVLRGRCDRA